MKNKKKMQGDLPNTGQKIYLHFTTDDRIENILRTKLIKNVPNSWDPIKKYIKVLNCKNEPIIAYVYDLELIEKTKCYIAYPYDYLGKTVKLTFKFLFEIIPIPFPILRHKLPKNGRAIIFTIQDKKKLENWYMHSEDLIEPQYCETVSSKPILVENIIEVPFDEALEHIGMVSPYNIYTHQNYIERKVVISKYKIGPYVL